MSKILISPGKYVQGAGAIDEIGRHIRALGTKGLVLGNKFGLDSVREALEKSCAANNISIVVESFDGECSKHEIERIVANVRDNQINVIVGVGGGKALDTAKAVAYYAKLPVAIVPTVAATDAPCSAISVIYNCEGIFESYLLLPKNPDLVLVDTGVVAKAPARLLVSGMGDALATWFEADACAKSSAANLPGGQSTAAALSLARLCYETIIKYGFEARIAVERQIVTEAVEKIVEANILLSGIGFESCGLAAAHAIHNGLTVLAETRHAFHGEKVAFGTLVQMFMENRSRAELEEVLMFCGQVGLPVTLADIGVTEGAAEKIMKVAEAACAPGQTIHNQPFKVTAEIVYAAIIGADNIGKEYKKGY